MARAPQFPGSSKSSTRRDDGPQRPSPPPTRGSSTTAAARVAAITQTVEEQFNESDFQRYESLLEPVTNDKEGRPDLNAVTRNRDALDDAYRWANDGRIWAERALKEWERIEANRPEQEAIASAREEGSGCPLPKNAERGRVLLWVMHHKPDQKLQLQKVATMRERMAFAVKRFIRLRDAFEKRATGLERILSAYTTTNRR